MFLSPPWGGPDYQAREEFDVDDLINGRGRELFETAQKITKNIAYFVPKNIKADQVSILLHLIKIRTINSIYLHSTAKKPHNL